MNFAVFIGSQKAIADIYYLLFSFSILILLFYLFDYYHYVIFNFFQLFTTIYPSDQVLKQNLSVYVDKPQNNECLRIFFW